MGKKSIQMLALFGLALATLIALSESVPSPKPSSKKHGSSPTNSPKPGQHAPPHNAAAGQHHTGAHAQSPHPGAHGQISPNKPGSPGKAAGKAAAAGGKAAAGAKNLPAIFKEVANEVASQLEKENEKAKQHEFKPIKYKDFVKPLAGKLHIVIAKIHHDITVKMIEDEEKKTKKPEQMDEFKRIYIKVELLKAIHEAKQKKTFLSDLAKKLEKDMSKHQKKQQKKKNPKLDKTARGLVKEIVFEHISTGIYGSTLNDKNPKTKGLKNEIKKALAELEKDQKHVAHVKEELNKLDQGMAPAHGTQGKDPKALGAHGKAAAAAHGAHGKVAAAAHGTHEKAVAAGQSHDGKKKKPDLHVNIPHKNGAAAIGTPNSHNGSPQQSPHGAHSTKSAQSPAGTPGKKDAKLTKSPSGKGAQHLLETGSVHSPSAKGPKVHHEHESHSSHHAEGGSGNHPHMDEDKDDYGSLLGQEGTNLGGVMADPESRLGEEAEREYGSAGGSEMDENENGGDGLNSANPMRTPETDEIYDRPPARALDDDNDENENIPRTYDDNADRSAPFSESMNTQDTEEVGSAKFGDEDEKNVGQQSLAERLDSEDPRTNDEKDGLSSETAPAGMGAEPQSKTPNTEKFWDDEDLKYNEHSAQQTNTKAAESAVPENEDEQIRGIRDTESLGEGIDGEGDKFDPMEGESTLKVDDGDEPREEPREISRKFSGMNATEPGNIEKDGDYEEMDQSQNLDSLKSIKKTPSGDLDDDDLGKIGKDEEIEAKKPTEQGLGEQQGA